MSGNNSNKPPKHRKSITSRQGSSAGKVALAAFAAAATAAASSGSAASTTQTSSLATSGAVMPAVPEVHPVLQEEQSTAVVFKTATEGTDLTSTANVADSISELEKYVTSNLQEKRSDAEKILNRVASVRSAVHEGRNLQQTTETEIAANLTKQGKIRTFYEEYIKELNIIDSEIADVKRRLAAEPQNAASLSLNLLQLVAQSDVAERRFLQSACNTLVSIIDASGSQSVQSAWQYDQQLQTIISNMLLPGQSAMYISFGNYVQIVQMSSSAETRDAGISGLRDQDGGTYGNPAALELLEDLQNGVIKPLSDGGTVTVQITTDGQFDDPNELQTTLTQILGNFPYVNLVFVYIDGGQGVNKNVGSALVTQFGAARVNNDIVYPSVAAAIADQDGLYTRVCAPPSAAPSLPPTNTPSVKPTTAPSNAPSNANATFAPSMAPSNANTSAPSSTPATYSPSAHNTTVVTPEVPPEVPPIIAAVLAGLALAPWGRERAKADVAMDWESPTAEAAGVELGAAVDEEEGIPIPPPMPRRAPFEGQEDRGGVVAARPIHDPTQGTVDSSGATFSTMGIRPFRHLPARQYDHNDYAYNRRPRRVAETTATTVRYPADVSTPVTFVIIGLAKAIGERLGVGPLKREPLREERLEWDKSVIAHTVAYYTPRFIKNAVAPIGNNMPELISKDIPAGLDVMNRWLHLPKEKRYLQKGDIIHRVPVYLDANRAPILIERPGKDGAPSTFIDPATMKPLADGVLERDGSKLYYQLPNGGVRIEIAQGPARLDPLAQVAQTHGPVFATLLHDDIRSGGGGSTAPNRPQANT